MQVMKAISVLALLMLTHLAAAADPKPTTAPAAVDQTPLVSRQMPTIDFAGKSFAQVLQLIKEKNPDFHYAVFRGPSVEPEFPPLAGLKLEAATIGQFFELVENEYDVRFTWIEAPRPFAAMQGVWNSAAPICQIDIKQQRATPKHPVVRVFGLGEIIEYRASLSTPADEVEQRASDKRASDDILSLVEEAVSKLDAPVEPEFTFHPPTQALICKCTSEQAEVIEQALTALRPNEQERAQMVVVRNTREMYERQKAAELADQRKRAATQPSK